MINTNRLLPKYWTTCINNTAKMFQTYLKNKFKYNVYMKILVVILIINCLSIIYTFHINRLFKIYNKYKY